MVLIRNQPCAECGLEDPISLFHIPHRGTFAKLCTRCVLANNLTAFCIICFNVHEETHATVPDPNSQAMCKRCPALVHLACLDSTSFRTRYLCPRCSVPSFKFFDVRKAADDEGGSKNAMTRDLCKEFLCAAKIAYAAMHRAKEEARANAEEKARESVEARRLAFEAIGRVQYLKMVEEQQARDAKANLEVVDNNHDDDPQDAEGLDDRNDDDDDDDDGDDEFDT